MKNFLFLLLQLPFLCALAQVDLSYYLPDQLSYDPNIPTPKEVLGYHPDLLYANDCGVFR